MKNWKLIISAVLCLVIDQMAIAQQEPQFTQYFDNTLFVNPAYAGSRGVMNMTAIHREQWAGFDGRPRSTTFSLHSPLKYESVGIGLTMVNDQLGPITQRMVYGDFSYSLKFKNGDRKLSFGLKGGVNMISVGTSQLVTTVDNDTREKLLKAQERDLYLSDVSPLGVPFNNLRNNSKDIEKSQKINEGKPGSSCPRRFLALSNEYGEQGVCTASRKFQKIKIKESNKDNSILLDKVFEKTCLCMGLAAAAVINNDIEVNKESQSVSICPGPNLAYFSKYMSLILFIFFIMPKQK